MVKRVVQPFTIHCFTIVIGQIVSISPGAHYIALHYRVLEYISISALQRHNNNFDVTYYLTPAVLQDFFYWITLSYSLSTPILRDHPDSIINISASVKG